MSMLLSARDEDGSAMSDVEVRDEMFTVLVAGHETTATLVAWVIHRRPDLWPEPNSFDPRRFVGRRTDPYTFFPFGGGVRHCLGAAFATYEAKIVLSRVLCRVILRPDPDYAVRVVRRGLALGPSAGLPVIRMAT